MSGYTQLTQRQRYQIDLYRNEFQLSQAEIVKHNGTPRHGYQAERPGRRPKRGGGGKFARGSRRHCGGRSRSCCDNAGARSRSASGCARRHPC